LFGNTIKIAITFALLVAFFWGSGVFVEDSGRDSSIRWDDGSFFIMSNECEIFQGSPTLRQAGSVLQTKRSLVASLCRDGISPAKKKPHSL
jgi:hypothetical protein